MKKIFIVLIICINSFNLIHGYSASYIQYLQSSRLESYSTPLKNNFESVKPESFWEMRNVFKRRKQIIIPKTIAEKLEILWKEYGVLDSKNKPFIDKDTLESLELVKSSNPEENFINHIVKDPLGVTAFGEKKFVECIGMPQCNISEILRRQNNIKKLTKDYDLLDRAHTMFRKMKKQEQFTFKFFGQDEIKDRNWTPFMVLTNLFGLGEHPWMATVFDKWLESTLHPLGGCSLFYYESFRTAFLSKRIICN